MDKTRYKIKFAIAAILTLVSGPMSAQTLLAPEQLIERYEISDLDWSANGQRLALVISEPASEDG